MRRLISVGLALAVVGLGIWTYQERSTTPGRGRDLTEPSFEQRAHPILRLEGLGDDQEDRPPSMAAGVVPSGLVSSDSTAESEEPL